MGIVNVTPDSFSDGGRFASVESAVAQAKKLCDEGADWIDLGAESTRPGAEPVSEAEELRRVEPVLERLAGTISATVSIDTYKPAVARRAIALGAEIINDVTGFRDPKMVAVAAESDTGLVCMHMRGTPENMATLAEYTDVVGELKQYFSDRLAMLSQAGVALDRVSLDPGIGFAKRTTHGLTILRSLASLCELGRPLLLGVSRKRLIAEVTGQPTLDRLGGTIGAVVHGYLNGARIFRVHDVAPIRQALTVVKAIQAAG